jgi:hypothetical protein
MIKCVVCVVLYIFYLCKFNIWRSEPVSSVGIANGYGLESPGIESRWSQDFQHTSIPALGPTQPPV